MRIGTSHRSFHLLSCSHRLNFSRKNSALHESQLNFQLLKPLGLTAIPSMEEVMSMTSAFKVEQCPLPDNLAGLLEKNNKTVVLHPKSQGSALEWPLESYLKLANELVAKGYTVYFTGTEQEGDLFRSSLPINDNIIDLTGKLSLKELIYFISKVKNLVACSTGPLHIAGFLGVRAIGLFHQENQFIQVDGNHLVQMCVFCYMIQIVLFVNVRKAANAFKKYQLIAFWLKLNN